MPLLGVAMRRKIRPKAGIFHLNQRETHGQVRRRTRGYEREPLGAARTLCYESLAVAIGQLTPPEAHAVMLADPKAVYLDVRSPEEFAQAHPAGAFNLPLAFLEPGRGPTRPNPEFLQVASRRFSTDTVFLVGCLSGGRSMRACDLLSQAGFTNLSNVEGGFGGGRDRSGGLVRGWRDCGLPTDSGDPVGRSYTHLAGSSD